MNSLPSNNFPEPDRDAGLMDQIRLARAYLLRVAEPPAPALSALIDICGPIEAAHQVRSGDAPAAVRTETSGRCTVDMVEADFAAAAMVGARLVIPEDAEWPTQRLLALHHQCTDCAAHTQTPPVALWVRGPARLDEAMGQAVTITGARSATSYGQHVATDFAYGLAEAGVTVVSGAAYGVDGAAHRGALIARGTTVAVFPCGVDLAYPAAHADMIRQIGETGVLVSEYPPGQQPARHRIPARNRLLASLSAATVIVEAGFRSGARNAARTAAELGRVVMVVPGPITSSLSEGCHELLRDGIADIACSVPEILTAAEPHFTRPHHVDPPTPATAQPCPHGRGKGGHCVG